MNIYHEVNTELTTRKALNKYIDKLTTLDPHCLAKYGVKLPLWKSIIYDLISLLCAVFRFIFVIPKK